VIFLITEEILHTHIAHWWSPQGSYIAYLQFNDTLVPKYRFPYYGDGKNIYGDIEELSYPKVITGDTGETLTRGVIINHIGVFIIR